MRIRVGGREREKNKNVSFDTVAFLRLCEILISVEVLVFRAILFLPRLENKNFDNVRQGEICRKVFFSDSTLSLAE